MTYLMPEKEGVGWCPKRKVFLASLKSEDINVMAFKECEGIWKESILLMYD